MTIHEEKQDLLLVPQGYYLAHCISGDYTLGAGLAKKIDEVYDMKKKLKSIYPSHRYQASRVGDAILVDNVFNLVDKEHYYDTADYEDLFDAILDMASQIDTKMVRKLAIPHLGCGKDHLDWAKVKLLIEKAFSDMDIDILVCTI